MDVTSIRQANLKTLVADLTARLGTKKLAALALDLGASYQSQLLAGKKMGDDVARKIEAAQGLPHGWMDQQHSRVGEPPGSYSHVLRIDPDTIAASLKLLRLTSQNLQNQGIGVAGLDPELDGTPLAFAYEFLVRKGQKSVTAENVIDFSKALAERLRDHEHVEEGTDQRTRKSGSTG